MSVAFAKYRGPCVVTPAFKFLLQIRPTSNVFTPEVKVTPRVLLVPAASIVELVYPLGIKVIESELVVDSAMHNNIF